jgi:hypothetical protein
MNRAELQLNSDSNEGIFHARGFSLRKTARVIVAISIGLGCIGFCVYQWALQKTREVPDFYRQASERMPADLDKASRQLESEVHALTVQVGRLGTWEATFDEGQINAWLIHQLPKIFARVLPKGVKEPRVVLQEGKVLAAARYQDSRFDTVVSFELDVQLTAEPNVLAIEIRELKAGALPLPVGRFRDSISRWAARDSLEVRWDTNSSNDPIALVTVPSDHESYLKKPVIVESVTLTQGALRLAGHTGPEARIAYKPRGPVYRLASLRSGILHDSQCDPKTTHRSKL